MGNTSSNRRVTSQDRAILAMKLQRDKLQQYQRKIQNILNREHAIAKECLSRGDKSRALLALRRRKYQESLLAKTDAQLETLQQLTSSIEFSLIEKDVLYGLRQGNDVLKAIQKEMSLEAVEKLMDETAEAIQYQREVTNMLAGAMTNAEEDEVDDELERLEREVAIAQGREHELPEVPKTEPVMTADEQRRSERAKQRFMARKAELQSSAAEPIMA